MGKKTGEYLEKQATWIQKYLDRRAQSQDFTGYEWIDAVTGFGRTALQAVGGYSGKNDEVAITPSGELLIIDENHPITQVALTGRTSMKALFDLTVAMDGGNEKWSHEKQQHIQLGRDDIAHTVGQKIIGYLYRQNNG